MLPQFISLGPLTLNSYTFLVTLAAFASLAWWWVETRDARILPSALILAFGALVGGRTLYVAMHWDYFREHTNEILSLAGLSEHGAILGGLFVFVVARGGEWGIGNQESEVGNLLPTPRSPLPSFHFLLLFTAVAIAASLGCIPNGCGYGREVFWQTDGEYSLAWLLHADWPDAYSIRNPRWPTQALLAMWMAIVGLSFTLWAQRRASSDREARQPGATLPAPACLIFAFAIGDFLIQFLRGDPAAVWGGLRIYQWLDLALLFAGVAPTLVQIRARKRWAGKGPNP